MIYSKSACLISKIIFILGLHYFLGFLKCVRSYTWSKDNSDSDLNSVLSVSGEGRQQKKWKALAHLHMQFLVLIFNYLQYFQSFFLMQDLTLSFATCEFKLTIISNRVTSYIFSKIQLKKTSSHGNTVKNVHSHRIFSRPFYKNSDQKT